MKIVLIRHGRAEERSRSKDADDAGRALTAEGKKRSRQVACALRAIGLQPGVLCTSPLVRAAETAAIFAREFDLPPDAVRVTRSLLPEASSSAWLNEMRVLDEKCVFSFGHAPNLDRLVARLIGTKGPVTALKKSGVIVLDVRSLTRANAIVEMVLTPGVLRRTGRR